MDQAPENIEVWKNVTKGMRWFTRFDVTGREADGRVQGGRTFTLTPFERQINQEKAATKELDLFRNGTFVMVRGAEGTIEAEVRSPNSLTQNDLSDLAIQVLAEPGDFEDILSGMEGSVPTLDRFKEFLIAHSAPSEVTERVQKAINQANAGDNRALKEPVVRRRIVGSDEIVETAPPPAE
jgi:hypothetical protein